MSEETMTDYEMNGIAIIRRTIPEFKSLSDETIRKMYRHYSGSFYCAGWYALETEADAKRFFEWLTDTE